MTNFNNIDAALIAFKDAAIKHANATDEGESKIANKCYTIISNAILFLKHNDAIEKLSPFLQHESVGVRMWATYLLPIKESMCIQVLEKIAKDQVIHSLTAETTLAEWVNGNFKV